MTSLQTDPRLGTTLAGYRIESLLGRGGMGVVYLAEDLRLKRKVALKLVAPELAADARFRERFLHEAELAASLDHSHVVPVHAAGETDGQLWIAMRYVEGTDLKALLEREGPLEPGRALRLLGQIASALDAAHAHRLLHRDVKPANVLVTEEDGEEHCYLTDFGLARGVDADADPTATPHLSGTVDYTAPEQIAHEPLDNRTDVYSLGCVLYECLAGQPPFRRARPTATLFAHAGEPPPSLHEARPELPEAIDPVVAKALAKDPAQRFESCRALVEAAGDALGLVERRISRRRLILLTIGGAAALAAAAAVPAILLSRGDEAAAPKPVLPLADTSLVRVDPETLNVVAAIELGGAPVQVAAGLGSLWVADPRESALKEIDPVANTVARTIDLTQAGPPTSVAVGGDAVWINTFGQTIAQSTVWRLDPRTGSFSLFADGAGVDTVEERTVWLYDYKDDALAEVDVDTRRVVETVRIPRSSSTVGHPYFDGESLWIVYLDAPSLLRRLNPVTSEVVAEIEVGPVETILVQDGEVWVATNDGSVLRIDPATNLVVDRIEVGRSPKYLALGGGSLWVADARDPVIARVDPETGDVVTIRVGGTPLSIAFGEGGLWVLVRPS